MILQNDIPGKLKRMILYQYTLKNAGRANTENKYELPPPVDSDLYFGKLVVIRHSEQNPTGENCLDITFEEWKTIYEKLMGGF